MSFTSGLGLMRGDGDEVSETFNRVPEVTSLSGLGATNPTIDVTSWDSTAKEYIGGLADGAEVTIELNRILSDDEQDGLISDVENKVNRNFTLAMDDQNETETFEFTLAMTGWTITPAQEDKHTLSVTGKLSGAITRSVA